MTAYLRIAPTHQAIATQNTGASAHFQPYVPWAPRTHGPTVAIQSPRLIDFRELPMAICNASRANRLYLKPYTPAGRNYTHIRRLSDRLSTNAFCFRPSLHLCNATHLGNPPSVIVGGLESATQCGRLGCRPSCLFLAGLSQPGHLV